MLAELPQHYCNLSMTMITNKSNLYPYACWNNNIIKRLRQKGWVEYYYLITDLESTSAVCQKIFMERHGDSWQPTYILTYYSLFKSRLFFLPTMSEAHMYLQYRHLKYIYIISRIIWYTFYMLLI